MVTASIRLSEANAYIQEAFWLFIIFIEIIIIIIIVLNRNWFGQARARNVYDLVNLDVLENGSHKSSCSLMTYSTA